MMRQMTLSVSQSKRLIAKGVAKWPPVVERLNEGMIVVAKGTTNRYVAEELLGKSLDTYSFAWGLVAPPGTQRSHPDDIPEIVLVDGTRRDMDIEDAIDSMSSGDIFIKGGNALHYESRTVGILSTGSTGGTIGCAYPKIVGSRIRLILPIGLEKCVSTPIERICSVMNAPGLGTELPRMFPVRGDVFTEIEAIETLCDVEALHVASGGVAGYEGSVRLVIRGTSEALESVGEIEESLREEQPYKP